MKNEVLVRTLSDSSLNLIIVSAETSGVLYFFSLFVPKSFFSSSSSKNWIGKNCTKKKSSHINCTRFTFDDDDDDDAQKTHKNDGLCGGGGRDFVVVRRPRGGGGFVFSGGKRRRRPFFDTFGDTTQHLYEEKTASISATEEGKE